MSLFHRHHPTTISAPVSGKMMPISAVSDPVFSSKAVGDGFAVQPDTGEVFSPITGTVTSVFPTKHALSLKTKTGLEVLLHLGIDTVELNGKGFTVNVSEGESITPETHLADMDLQFLASQGKDAVVMTLFTDLKTPLNPVSEGTVTHGQEVLIID